MTRRPCVEVDEAVGLSAQHITGEPVEDDGELLAFRITDGEQAVDLSHEIGDPEGAALALVALADRMRAHAERIRHRARVRAAGWT